MTIKEKLAAALTDLEILPIRFDVHDPIRELQENLDYCIEAEEAAEH